MKKTLILIGSIIIYSSIVSCVDAPSDISGRPIAKPVRPVIQPGSVIPSKPVARSMRWKQVKLTGGKVDLYLVINGKEYYMKQVQAFSTNKRSDFRSSGVPASAKVAGIYWMSDQEEDSEGIYAKDNGNSVSIYTGSYDPGFMHDVNWGLLRTIRF